MNWLTLSLLSLLFFSLLPLVQRKVAVKNRYPRATGVLFILCTLPFNLVILFASGSLKKIALPSDFQAWIFLALGILFYGLFERGRFVAAKRLNSSTLSIVTNISLVVSFIGSMLLYSEKLNYTNVVGAIMIFVSLVLLSYERKMKLDSIKNISVGILVYTLMGLAWIFDKKGALYFGADVYNFLAWTLPIFIVIFPKVKLSELKYEMKNSGFMIFVPAFVNVAGYFLQLKAMETGNATQIIPLVQTSTLLAVLLGIVFLGEREGVIKKIFAGVIALIGSYLLIGAV